MCVQILTQVGSIVFYLFKYLKIDFLFFSTRLYLSIMSTNEPVSNLKKYQPKSKSQSLLLFHMDVVGVSVYTARAVTKLIE